MARQHHGVLTAGDLPFPQRLIGAARLNRATYAEVARDFGATGQAALIVVAAFLSGAIGGADDGGEGFLTGLAASLLGWVLLALIVYVIGVRLVPGPTTRASVLKLLRVLGFALVPSLFSFLEIISPIEWIVGAVIGVWLLLTHLVAIREALSVRTGHAFVVAIAAVAVYGVTRTVLFWLIFR